MTEMLSAVWEGIEAARGDGRYLALFFVGMTAIAFYKDKREKQYWYYGILMFVLLLFPPSVWLLKKYQTGFYSVGNLWSFLPVTGMTAYAAVALLDMAGKPYAYGNAGTKITSREKRPGLMGARYGKHVLTGIFCAVILLAGSMHLASEDTDRAVGGEKIPQAQRMVLDWIAENIEKPCIWGPREVLETAREYSGGIRLLYGRNMWEEILNAYTYDTYDEESVFLYAWMERQLAGMEESPLENMQLAVETAVRKGCNVLVLRAGDEWIEEQKECVSAMGYLDSAYAVGDYLILTLHCADAS